jgi:tetratricopeptide (TPR) repeat protein/transcriptional regulator with XRE-family HTH domain
MDDYADFSTVLRAYIYRARRTTTDLAQLTGLSVNTLRNWTAGKVDRPREVGDVLKLARALELGVEETSALLRAAGHSSFAQLQMQAQHITNPRLSALLAWWNPANRLPAPPLIPTRYQLRPPIADFVGRAAEAARLVSALRQALTEGQGASISGIHGMGGIGKTELAYVVAHQLHSVFPDGQVLVSLRGTSSAPLGAEQALQTVVRAFAPDERLPDSLDALQARYQAVLQGRRVLILADDARDVAQVRALPPPLGCALLITSRQRFSLPGITSVNLEQLAEEEAVTLVQRICAGLSKEQAEALARGCGGLPLALRVGSSMLRTDPALPIAAYLERLMDERQRLDQLRDPEEGLLDVAASLSLSYAQLDAATQRVFRQLGIFVADFSTALALAVVAAPQGVEVEAALHRLLRRNLVMYDIPSGRWRLHDLMRALALDYLVREGEREATLWRYARVAVRMAQEIDDQYLAGESQVQASLARFDAERTHIDAAWAWAIGHARMPDGDSLLLALALTTTHVGELRYDTQRERIPQLEQALAAAERLADRQGEGRLRVAQGRAAFDLGDDDQAIRHFEQAQAIFEELGDRHSAGRALGNLGTVYARLGNPQCAIHYYQQARAIFQELGDQRLVGHALGNLGDAYAALGALPQATSYLEQALPIARTVGDRRFEAMLLHTLGKVGIAGGDPHTCRAFCEQALEIARAVGDRQAEGYALLMLGNAAAALGDGAGAQVAFKAALAIFQAIGDRWGQAECRWQRGLFLAGQSD